jgi:two-component system phosphate regulon sensor histidine kinase PhoR
MSTPKEAIKPADPVPARRSLGFEFWFLTGSVTAALLMIQAGAPGAVVWPLTLAPYVLRNLWFLTRLAFLIRRQHCLAPPFPAGLWGEVYRAIAQYQQRGRKRRKRQVRFTRRFREAAVSVPDALVILDKQQRIEWANPAAALLMDVQWPRDDGKRLTDLLRQPQLAEFIESGDYARPIDLAPEHNRAIMLSVRVTLFGERKRQRLVVARDITKVYHLNMIRRDFVANASHELRTPLTVIAGFLETLGDSALTPQGHRRPIQLMRNQTERMRSIIEDLLTLSRLEMEDRSEDVHAADVPQELQEVIHEAQALSEGRHELVVEIDQDLLLLGNLPELRSAFSNLVYNAVKHTPPGSRIRVVWREDGRGPLFSVQDNGQGIEPEHIPRLTERFYRIDKARSRVSGGTGLGLAIVKHVLNRHDARLIIASEVGHGTTFTCRFPVSLGIRRGQLPASGPAASDTRERTARSG